MAAPTRGVLSELAIFRQLPRQPSELPRISWLLLYTRTVREEQSLLAAFVKRNKRDRYREILDNPLLPGVSGFEVASTIVDSGSRVLMFTMHASEHLPTEVLKAGAQGYVLKSQAGKDSRD